MESKLALTRRFFKVMIPGFHEKLNIPPAFSKHLQGEKPRQAVLTSPRGTWKMEVCRTNEGSVMCLRDGWPQFVLQHSLSVGDFLVFEHNGGFHFNVSIFDRTACEKDFLVRPIKKEHDQESNALLHPRKPLCEREKELAKSHNSRDPHFVLTMKPYHANKFPWVNIPKEFCKSVNLKDKPYMTVRDPLGRSWPMKLNLQKNGQTRVRIRCGWHDFYASNGLKNGDVCVFGLARLSLESTAILMDVRIFPAPGIVKI